MNRRAAGIGHVSGPRQASSREARIPPDRDWQSAPPLVGGDELRQMLGCGRSHLDAPLDAGLPNLKIGSERRGGRMGTWRTLRMLPYEPTVVLAWLRHRSGGSGA